MAQPRPLLTFRMTLGNHSVSGLQRGTLYLQERNKQQGEYVCTSGLPHHQFWGSWSEFSRGPIPPCLATKVEYYQVQIQPINMRTIVGISGYFYAILPQIMRIESKSRSGFGIHWDANVPGTAGCIGFRDPKQWSDFQYRMKQLEGQGEVSIRLLVEYKQLVP